MTKAIHDLVPSHIRAIDPYVPGKPIEEVERELRLRAAKLASNENPLGPSPLAVAAAKRAMTDANRYPDGGGHYLREKLAGRLGVGIESILLGAGSTELIDVLARTLLEHGDEGATSAGSFPMYYISIRASGARLIEVPQRDDAIYLDALRASITPRTKVVYLANPNNPTGTMFTADAFDAFLAGLPESVVVVLDEAYFEYVERQDYSRSIERVKEGRNLVVLRTFSKVYGLAGLRVGYAVGPAALLREVNKVRSPFNTSGVAQAAALAALDDVEHVRRSTASNRAGLKELAEGLAAMGVRYIPSAGNFLFVDLGLEAQPVADELLKLGVICRAMGWMGFPNGLRVTVGTHEENKKFLRALAQVRAAAGARQ
ncbi:MAG TPA: histidinol-phosphate transaminase [Candidatus Acidoferrales bacterium]|nr:histidinol-phosphate transaminase [Candidatus Acidoferrales bacterium]